jgi:hypothetical protein
MPPTKSAKDSGHYPVIKRSRVKSSTMTSNRERRPWSARQRISRGSSAGWPYRVVSSGHHGDELSIALPARCELSIGCPFGPGGEGS